MSGNQDKRDKVSAKILVLGDSGVGKSSLIHLICHSQALSSSQWTIGCSIDVKLYNDCYLEFWDIGGSRSHKIARSFLYPAEGGYHGIILVFDATNKKSRLNLSEWLMEVNHKTTDKDLDLTVNINVPTLTIATKKDLLPYSSILEIKENKSKVIDEHCSVVSFSEQQNAENQYGHLYRRNRATNSSQSSSASSSPHPAMMSTSFASFHSQQENAPLIEMSRSATITTAGPSEPLLGNHVIYVNTQDVNSFSPGTSEHDDLNNFFRQVIDRRNRFYKMYK